MSTKKELGLFETIFERPELTNAMKMLTSIGATYFIEYKGRTFSTQKKRVKQFNHPDIAAEQVANLKVGESYGWEIEAPRVIAAQKKVSFIPTILGWPAGSAKTEILPIDKNKSIVQLIRIK